MSTPTRSSSSAAARGRATQGAVADGQDATRAVKIRRSAWLLAALAAFFYLGYIAWIVINEQL